MLRARSPPGLDRPYSSGQSCFVDAAIRMFLGPFVSESLRRGGIYIRFSHRYSGARVASAIKTPRSPPLVAPVHLSAILRSIYRITKRNAGDKRRGANSRPRWRQSAYTDILTGQLHQFSRGCTLPPRQNKQMRLSFDILTESFERKGGGERESEREVGLP